jgi:hypothetical protein
MIWTEETEPGRGATFWVSLPASHADGRSPARRAESTEAAGDQGRRSSRGLVKPGDVEPVKS